MLHKTEELKRLFFDFNAKMIEIEGLIITIDNLIVKELHKTQPMSLLDTVLQKVSLLDVLIQNKKYEELKSRFPNILWASVFVTSFGSTEAVLDDLCSLVRQEKSIALSQSDLKDKGITRSYTYLSKAANFNLSNHSVEWDTLKRSNAVRNCLTHADGIIEDSQDKEFLKQIIRQNSTISEVKGHIVISKQFVLDFIAISKKLLSGITDIKGFNGR